MNARDDRDPQQSRAAMVREIQLRFGVLAWWGACTGPWWALVDRRHLVEAEDPRRLAEQIMSARGVR